MHDDTTETITTEDREALRREAQAIALSHPHVLKNVNDFWDGEQVSPIAPPVIITIPADLCSRDIEVLVRHEFGGVLVDVRGERHQAWTPAAMCGVTFEVRER